MWRKSIIPLFSLVLLVNIARVTGECKALSDIYIAVESSSKVGSIPYGQLKKFIALILNEFVIDPTLTEIGLVQFANDMEIVSQISANKADLLTKLNNMKRMNGVSNIHTVLKGTRESLKSSGRMDAVKALIIFTSGTGSHTGMALEQARKNHDEDIKTYVISLLPKQKGVGWKEWLTNTARAELHAIASGAEGINFYPLESFADENLNSILGDLVFHSCQDSPSATCVGTGDAHFQTFDGATITFNGQCQYVLAQRCVEDDSIADFQVFLMHEQKVTKVKRHLVIQTMGQHYAMYSNGKKLKVNGVRKQLPFMESYPENRFVKVAKGADMRPVLETSYGLKVSFMRNRFQVTVPKQYRDKTCGICGNFNSIHDDDYTLSNGTGLVEMIGTPLADEAFDLLGNDFRVGEDAVSCHCDPRETQECSELLRPVVYGGGYCGYLQNPDGPFGNCLRRFPQVAAQMYEVCVAEVCSSPDTESPKNIACEILESFAEECKTFANSYVDRNWRQLSECPMECGLRQVYSSDMSACPATCFQPEAPLWCNMARTDGCECEPGYVLEDDECVPVSACGCVDHYGYYHKLGDTWMGPSCHWKYTCKKNEENQSQICETAFQCTAPAVCGLHDGVLGCWDFEGPCIMS